MSISAWTDDLLKDLRYAARQFVRNPVFTAVAVASLAIGIGANTAIFSVLNAAMLKSLPVRDPQGLVMLTDPNQTGVSSGMNSGERGMLTYAEFTELRDHSTTLESLCAVQSEMNREHVRIAGGQQEDARTKLVSEEYFSVLGVDPAIGRFFSRSDAKSPGEDPYAVISYDYWQKRFGGNVSVLGTPIKLLGATLTVIGVAAPGFTGENVADKPDFWIPMMMQPQVMPGRDWLHEDLSKSLEKVMWLHAFGRLKPGVTQARAQTEINVIFRGLIENGYPATLDPETRKQAMDQHIKLRDARTGVFGGRDDFTQQLKILLGVSLLVLLIACINVANLLLARATSRAKEVGVRLSIGASRLRLVRQFLTESLVLSLLCGAVGLLFAWGASRVLVLLLTERRQDFALAPTMDWHVLIFTLGVTVLTGILFGLAPALRSTKVNLTDSLRDGGRSTASGSRLNLAKGLVIVQVAFSLLLVAGAGLFLRTLWNLQSVNLGYPKENLLLISADGVSAGYKDAQLTSLWHDLTERLRGLPGVQGATYSINGIFSGSESADEIDVEGFTASKREEKFSRFDMVGPQYFSTIGIPLLLGRDIGQQDTAASPHVCVINEALAKTFFNGRNPLGRHITEKFGDKRNVMEVVGVAKNARDHRLRGDVPPRFYLPADQGMGGPNEWAIFEIRTAGDPEQMIASVRKTMLSVNQDLPVEGARPVVMSVDRTNAQPRMVARLCSIFGIIALLLAATGLYGVLSYGVARRTNEIGIRMALGAGKGRVIQMILRETGVMIVLGVVAGVIFTAIGVQLIKSTLFGLGVLDPLTVLSSVAILTTVALVAGYIPAARAARVNPTQALRHE
jgi:predicted permease